MCFFNDIPSRQQASDQECVSKVKWCQRLFGARPTPLSKSLSPTMGREIFNSFPIVGEGRDGVFPNNIWNEVLLRQLHIICVCFTLGFAVGFLRLFFVFNSFPNPSPTMGKRTDSLPIVGSDRRSGEGFSSLRWLSVISDRPGGHLLLR